MLPEWEKNRKTANWCSWCSLFVLLSAFQWIFIIGLSASTNKQLRFILLDFILKHLALQLADVNIFPIWMLVVWSERCLNLKAGLPKGPLVTVVELSLIACQSFSADRLCPVVMGLLLKVSLSLSLNLQCVPVIRHSLLWKWQMIIKKV